MTDAKSKAKRITRWVNLVMWSIIGFFLIGYLPSLEARAGHLRPEMAVMITIALAAMGVIPYASKIGRPLKSGLIAVMLGLVAGASMGGGLTYLCATGAFCGGVGAVFGHLSQQRRRQAEEEWKYK